MWTTQSTGSTPPWYPTWTARPPDAHSPRRSHLPRAEADSVGHRVHWLRSPGRRRGNRRRRPRRPILVEIHDGTGTGIVVAVPLDLREGWTAEARERLAAARVALGET
ncbi:DUF5959 family protein [Streptomyces sp. KLOTTS4A1]|uniref:DUF5959 family protein n=1 Tax=Streptomyces sp. KLOTTS4A1 TaxID=3390996 RepID=UPI0039F44FE7